MARTKASVGAKVSSGKSSKARCSAAPPPSSSTSSGSTDRSGRTFGGGNPVCQRETPKWQRPITNFFIGKEQRSTDEMAAGSSKPRKRNVIESDEETEPVQIEESPEKLKNTVLDETIELQPLSGDDSHKIEEYYTKNGENVVQNGEGSSENVENQIQNGEKHVQNGEHHLQNGENHVQNGEDNPKTTKGKGKGKKTNKENINSNIEKRNSMKRDLEEINFGEESEQASKRIKID